MLQRGRKSAAALSVVAPIAGQRPEPPNYLSKAEAAEWRAIVARMPPDWFSPETWGLLAQLCRHMVLSKLVAAEGLHADAGRMIRDDPDLFDRLTRIHEREGRAISSLATRLRLTPQSRYDAAKAHRAVQSVPVVKPWELHR